MEMVCENFEINIKHSQGLTYMQPIFIIKIELIEIKSNINT